MEMHRDLLVVVETTLGGVAAKILEERGAAITTARRPIVSMIFGV